MIRFIRWIYEYCVSISCVVCQHRVQYVCQYRVAMVYMPHRCLQANDEGSRRGIHSLLGTPFKNESLRFFFAKILRAIRKQLYNSSNLSKKIVNQWSMFNPWSALRKNLLFALIMKLEPSFQLQSILKTICLRVIQGFVVCCYFSNLSHLLNLAFRTGFSKYKIHYKIDWKSNKFFHFRKNKNMSRRARPWNTF